MNTVTHISGDRFTVAGRVIQRCGICGEKLCDSRNVAMPLNPDGSTPEFPTWPPGRLIQFTTGNPRRELLLEDSDRLPPDSCIALVWSDRAAVIDAAK